MKHQSKKDKELADNAYLLRTWRKWHAEQLKQAQNGPHGVIVTQVVTFLEGMTPASASALLALMRDHCWEQVDADTKFVLLHEINTAITRMREKNGRPAIDDPLPGQPENVFRTIKAFFASSNSRA